MFSIPKKLKKSIFLFRNWKPKTNFLSWISGALLDSRIENGKRSDLDALLERVKTSWKKMFKWTTYFNPTRSQRTEWKIKSIKLI